MNGARDIDVSRLTRVAFDSRSLFWWGILGFLAIETTMLVICLVSYFYFRSNEVHWPPPPTAPPNLDAATVTLGLLLLSVPAMIFTERAARRFDLRRTLAGHVVCDVLGIAFVISRWIELDRLNVRWDANAYGSVVWVIIGLHTSHLFAEVVETVYFTYFLARHPRPNYFTDATDNALYWYFIVAIWVPCYVTLYLVPRMG
ncbi:MAG TPA: cytochrome c oxidase subunit 3 [Candidatus Limnocylindrales bacterium]|nr:cytochrome c oxidase subunit 3 [Candidatus Limnocylindrales bacterium]